MKKTILLFLFTLPVIIVVLVFAIAGFVGRRVMFIEIGSVTMSHSAQETHYYAIQGGYKVFANVGQSIPLQRYIILYPARANFNDLTIVSSDPGIASVENGYIRIHRQMRTSDVVLQGQQDQNVIDIEIRHGGETRLTILVQVETSPDAGIDYFGFNFDLFDRLSDELWREFITTEQRIIEVNDQDHIENFLSIYRAHIPSSMGNTLPIKDILERGFDTAPHDLLHSIPTNLERRNEFLGSLEFSVTGDAVEITGATMTITGTGEVIITVTYENFTLEIMVEIV